MLSQAMEQFSNYGRATVPKLLLDPAIRVWVVLPIFVVMLLVALARQYANTAMINYPELATTPAEIRQSSYLRYAQALLSNGTAVPQAHYRSQVAALLPGLRSGEYLADPNAKPPSPFSTTDPRMLEGLVAGARQQVMNYVPQTLLMSWVSSFFGGIIVMHLPFPLPYSFKEMLQAGIPAPELNVRYVSSISWYILLFVGLGPLTQLLTSEAPPVPPGLEHGHSQLAKIQVGPGMDTRRMMVQLADSLAIQNRKSVLSGVRERVLQMKL